MSDFLKAIEEDAPELPEQQPATPEELAFEAALDQHLKIMLGALREAMARHKAQRLVLVEDITLGDPLAEFIAASGAPVAKPEIRNSEGLEQEVQLVDIIDDTNSRRERLITQSLRVARSEALKPALPTQRARSVSAWLITDEPLQRLKERFEQRSRYPISPTAHRILRFWDPRVTQHIGRFFPRHSPASWLPGGVWLYIDSFADWNELPAPEGEGTWEIQPEANVLEKTSLVTLTLQNLAEDGLRHDKKILPAVIEAVEAVLRLKAFDEDDAACFAAHRVLYAKPLEKAPKMQEIIRYVRDEGWRYRNLYVGLGEEDWAEIINSIPESKNPESPQP
jgi:hypothetical protein